MRARRNPEVIAGQVNADGSVRSAGEFTAVKNGTGLYNLYLPPTFRLAAAVASPLTTTGDRVAVNTSAATGTFDARYYNAAGTQADGAFHFQAVGR